MSSSLSSPDPLGFTFGDILAGARHDRWRIALGSLAAGIAALALTYLIAPTFTATTTFLPPQQSQTSTANALSALGSLATIAGGSGIKSPAEQYVSLMQSAQVSDRILERHGLKAVYKAELTIDARRSLAERVRISLGKKDGLITVEVDDTVPQRAADVANDYVRELRRMTSTLALTEAQQRRVFFEQQLARAREGLARAQTVVQASGFDPGALRAEPKATAEAYARLAAELNAAEMRLQVLRSAYTENTPEVRQQTALVSALRGRLAGVERPETRGASDAYIDKYRDYKYQEALFETYAKQFELARVDESREGALIQVIDEATPPERKSKPRRGMTAILGTMCAALILLTWSVVRQRRRASAALAER